MSRVLQRGAVPSAFPRSCCCDPVVPLSAVGAKPILHCISSINLLVYAMDPVHIPVLSVQGLTQVHELSRHLDQYRYRSCFCVGTVRYCSSLLCRAGVSFRRAAIDAACRIPFRSRLDGSRPAWQTDTPVRDEIPVRRRRIHPAEEALEKRPKITRQIRLPDIDERRSSGQKIPDTLPAPIEDRRIVGAERKQRNQGMIRFRHMLDREQKRYRHVFVTPRMPPPVIDADGRILEANRAAPPLLSCTPGAFVGRLLDQFIDPDARPSYRAALKRAARGDNPANREISMRTAQEKTFPAPGTEAAEYELIEAVAELRWIRRDISEQRVAEEGRRRDAALFHRIQEDLERFAQVTSHELQEPIRIPVSSSSADTATGSLRVLPSSGDSIEGGATHRQTLNNDLPEYSRVISCRRTASRCWREPSTGCALLSWTRGGCHQQSVPARSGRWRPARAVLHSSAWQRRQVPRK